MPRRREATEAGRWGVALVVFVMVSGAVGALGAPQLSVTRTKYYLVHSDLDDALVYDLGTRLDAMYAEYSRRLSDFNPKADRKPLDVYIFKTREAYLQFTGGRHQNTGGVFLPAKNQLASYLDGQRDTLRRTLQHEAFHQFAHKALGPNVPVWMNEGLAQLFEEGIWTGEGFLMQQVPPRRLRQLQSDLKNEKLLPLKRLLDMTPEQWGESLAKDASIGAVQYNQAWAITHYMAYGEGGKNGVKLVEMLQGLNRGKDARTAFEDAFGTNLAAFKNGFEKYVAGLQPTAESALIDRHEVLTDLMAHLSERGKTFRDVAEFRKLVDGSKYKLRYTRGQVTWMVDPSVCFRDPAGQLYGNETLYFDSRAGAPLPDLVLRQPGLRLSLRGRFFPGEGKRVAYEVLVEPPVGAAADLR
ncbi:MAG TPA: DUF1570 domain-containing protein [Tepidisphaeraceae bacterium]|nr:DUF1570 domain-containing protein [Tepidisphaeraceae bacterium]